MIELLLAKLLFATPASTTCNIGPILFDPSCFLSLPPNIWFPYFMLIIFVVIGIIAVIYMLSSLLGSSAMPIFSPLIGRTVMPPFRNDTATWSKIKIYELLLTVALAVIFLAVSSLLYTINPTGVLSSTGLLPSTCNPNIGTNTPNSSNVNNLYAVALCDMYQYNVDVNTFSTGIFFFSFVAGIAPTANINAAGLIGGPPLLPSGGTGVGSGPGLGLSASVNLLPIQAVFQYIIPLMSAFFAVVILAQVQQILLSACMIMFSIFMIIGLVARAFTVTKTFGGSMIAFALGIGFVYPLVTLLSYGFLDVAIQHATTAIGGSGVDFFFAIVKGLLGAFLAFFGGSTPLATCPILTGQTGGSLSCVVTPLVIYGGFVSIGLVLIPILNLVIVDAFIVDVSRVIGERMDLLSLLTRIV